MLGYVIGDNDMTSGFRLVGVEGVEVSSINEAYQALDEALGRNDLALIIISEEFSLHPQIHHVIDQIRQERRAPLIVEIPGKTGTPNEARMSDLISKIIGVKL